MAIDTSMYQGVERPDAGNLLQAYATAAQASNARAQNALLQMQTQQAQQQLNDSQALRTAYAGAIDPTTGQIDYGKMYGSLAQAGAGNQIPGVAKSQMEMRQMQIDQATKALGLQKQLATQVMAAPTQANAQASLDQMEGLLGKGSMAAERQRVAAMGDDQGQIKAWALGHAVDADKVLPQYHQLDNGTTIQPKSFDPVTNQLTDIGAPVAKQVSPDTTATVSAENARAAAKLAEEKRYHDMMGGAIGENGQLTVGAEAQAQAIARGDQPMPTGRAAMAGPGAAILARAYQINPQLTAGTAPSRAKAINDFSNGPDGTAVQNIDKASQHIVALKTAAEALQNGGIPALNKLGNWFSQQTGATAPTDFNTVKAIAMDEVTKGIVGSGMGVGDREKYSEIVNSAQTPQQLATAINGITDLMGAQLDSLNRKYMRSTNSNTPLDSRFLGAPGLQMMTDYQARHGGGMNQSGQQQKAPINIPMTNAQGWVLHTDAHGNHAYVSPDGKQYQEVQ